MNLDETDQEAESSASTKKLSRKEKKALKRAEKLAAKHAKAAGEPAPSPETTADAHSATPPASSEDHDAEVDAELEPAPVPNIPPPHYSAWEKISPPARRKKQLATMESGYREVLALVHSMRENQEVLMHSFQKLPEAVDSVKKLADHSAQQSDLLTAMNEQLQAGSPAKFNDTLTSMDKTTQLLLERAQRSEERLYSMLRRAQRRIAFMTLLVLLLFLGTAGAILFLAFPNETRGWLEERGWGGEQPLPPAVEEVLETPAAEPEASTASDMTENPAPSATPDMSSSEVAEEAESDLEEPLPIPPPPKVEVPTETEADTEAEE
jgi:hypothetical protein